MDTRSYYTTKSTQQGASHENMFNRGGSGLWYRVWLLRYPPTPTPSPFSSSYLHGIGYFVLLHEQLHVEPCAPEELCARVDGDAVHGGLWCRLGFCSLRGWGMHWGVLDMLIPLPLAREDHVTERALPVRDQYGDQVTERIDFRERCWPLSRVAGAGGGGESSGVLLRETENFAHVLRISKKYQI